MAPPAGTKQRFVTAAEAADLLSFSRPDSFVRSWKAAGMPIFRRPSGRILVAEADLERFVSRDDCAHPPNGEEK